MSEFKNVIQGVSCDVSDCVYHCADCTCAAGKIQVSNDMKNSKNQTKAAVRFAPLFLYPAE